MWEIKPILTMIPCLIKVKVITLLHFFVAFTLVTQLIFMYE